jgi:hypothetical protein
LPSPKSQAQETTLPSLSVEVSVKLAARSEALVVNEAFGGLLVAGSVTVTDWLALSPAPSSSVTVSVTV